MTPYYPTVVATTIVLHLVWAVGLLVEPSAIHATSIHTALILAGCSQSAALLFATVATLAFAGLLTRDYRWRIGLILPQHIALWISVVGAVYAMYLGQFADGVQRSHWFLIVDQAPIVLIACGHTAALLFIGKRGRVRG